MKKIISSIILVIVCCISFAQNKTTFFYDVKGNMTSVNYAGSVQCSQLPVITKKDVLCYGQASGSITITATPGTGPFTYRLGSTGSFTSTTNYTGLVAGNYVVNIKDTSGSIVSSSVTINQPAGALSITSNQTNVSCYGGKNGTITGIATKGTPPYVYKNGAGTYQSSGLFSGLGIGSYRIYVQDTAGCAAFTNIVTITQPAALSSTFTKTDATCLGASNGTINVTASGGKPPYQYKNGTGAYQNSGTFTGLKAGNYRIYILDSNGCTGFSSLITINQPSTSCFIYARTATKEPDNSNGNFEVKVSPNPSSSQFKLTIQSNNEAKMDIRVVDVLGKVVYQTTTLSNQSIRFGESLISGVYLVEVKQGNNVKTVRIVKQ